MSELFTISMRHGLGQEEARKRIESGTAWFRSSFASQLSACEETWTDNHLDFKVGFMGQTCTGTLDVADDHVRLEVFLPGLLAFFANKVKSMVNRKGQLLLEGR